MKHYLVIDPAWDLPESERFKPENAIETMYSEADILRVYWTYWHSRMAERFGDTHPRINYRNCIDDWVCTNWAVEVHK